LSAVCEDIANLVALSTLILPLPSVGRIEEEEEYELEEEDDNTPNPFAGMLISLTDGGMQHEPKNVAQIKMERMEKRQSKRLSASIVNTVRQSISEGLAKAIAANEGSGDATPDISSYVKSQVHEIEHSLQKFEQKLQDKTEVAAPREGKKLAKKTTRFEDITEGSLSSFSFPPRRNSLIVIFSRN